MTHAPVQATIAELARMPEPPLVVKGLQQLLEAEQPRRRAFYEIVKEDEKAEFINGEIVYQSPVKLAHSKASENLHSLLKTFAQKHNLGYVGHEKLLVALTRNDYKPDICFWRQERAAQFTPDQSKFPAPDMIVEVLSASMEAIDRETKFNDYAAHGVSEYWLVDPETEMVEQYVLHDEQYALSMKSPTGIITSPVVSGFAIPVRAIFDASEHLATLTRILST